MEILKTSETLEQQILEDARRKASRVLEAAERDVKAMGDQWEAKALEESRRIDAEGDAKARALRQELDSSLPLDFMRTRLAATEEALREALNELFAGLGPVELARILGLLLAKAGPSFDGTRVAVTCRGMEPAAARAVVAEALPGAGIDSVTSEPAEAGGLEPGAGKGMIVATIDGRIRFRATLGELASLLLEERREELATALLGDAKAQ